MALPVSTRRTDAGRIAGAAAIPGCIEVVLQFLLANGRTGHVILHGRNLGSFIPAVPTANSLFTALSGHWSTAYGTTYAPIACAFSGLTVRDMSLTTNPIFQSTAAAVNGGSASLAMADEIALVLTAGTTARGRGRKGRMYLPCWATNADAAGGLAQGALTALLNTFGNNILADFAGAGMASTIANPARQAYMGVTGASHLARPAGTNDVTSWTLRDLRWDSQRRRSEP
jgi:hypothetical protein